MKGQVRKSKEKVRFERLPDVTLGIADYSARLVAIAGLLRTLRSITSLPILP
jgi:hypothetical protein